MNQNDDLGAAITAVLKRQVPVWALLMVFTLGFVLGLLAR